MSTFVVDSRMVPLETSCLSGCLQSLIESRLPKESPEFQALLRCQDLSLWMEGLELASQRCETDESRRLSFHSSPQENLLTDERAFQM